MPKKSEKFNRRCGTINTCFLFFIADVGPKQLVGRTLADFPRWISTAQHFAAHRLLRNFPHALRNRVSVHVSIATLLTRLVLIKSFLQGPCWTYDSIHFLSLFDSSLHITSQPAHEKHVPWTSFSHWGHGQQPKSPANYRQTLARRCALSLSCCTGSAPSAAVRVDFLIRKSMKCLNYHYQLPFCIF